MDSEEGRERLYICTLSRAQLVACKTQTAGCVMCELCIRDEIRRVAKEGIVLPRCVASSLGRVSRIMTEPARSLWSEARPSLSNANTK